MASKSNEWYTPAKYVEAARTVMGGIDLDPASCALANEIVKASRYYTAEENGLMQPWHGRVWLNPPYSSLKGATGRTAGRGPGLTAQFIQRLVKNYHVGNVEQAVLLVTTDTDAKWFIPLWEFPICFADHKVMFHRPGAANMGQFFGSSFVYLGTDVAKFAQVFSRFGRVAMAIDMPKPKPVALELWEGLVA